MTITADQLHASQWMTLSHTDFARGGWGYHWKSIDFPELQKKVWRNSRHEPTRGSLIVAGQHLGVHQLQGDGTGFPEDVWRWAAHLLEARRSQEEAA